VRILFLGDVMGRSGRDAVAAHLPDLRRRLTVDLAVVNGENMAHGLGMMPEMVAGLYRAGADVVTSGNHVWDRKEIGPYMENDPKLLRPINFPPGAPGRGLAEVAAPHGGAFDMRRRRLCEQGLRKENQPLLQQVQQQAQADVGGEPDR